MSSLFIYLFFIFGASIVFFFPDVVVLCTMITDQLLEHCASLCGCLVLLFPFSDALFLCFVSVVSPISTIWYCIAVHSLSMFFFLSFPFSFLFSSLVAETSTAQQRAH